jgi:hypothetical protein
VDSKNLTLHPWLSSNPRKQALITQSNFDSSKILAYASDKTLTVHEKKLYLITFRASVDIPVLVFLRNFKDEFAHYGVTTRVSNASPDEGPVSFAGEILYKHPRYTHCLHCNQYLHSVLPKDLDMPCIKKLADGSTVVCSLRKWVIQLKLADGTQAHCNVDKGTRKVVIICPQVHHDYVKTALNNYYDTLRTSHPGQQWSLPIPQSIFLDEVLTGSTNNAPNPWFQTPANSHPV